MHVYNFINTFTPLIFVDYGLKFILNDSSRLKQQKRQLEQQVRSGYEVNYQTDTLQKKFKSNLIKQIR